MHVAVANLTQGGLSGGSRKYLQRVLPLLAADPRISRLDIFVPPAFQGDLSRMLSRPVFTWPESDPRRGFPNLTNRLRHLRPDVVFVPGARSLPLSGIPQVIMFRNMEPPTFPFLQNAWLESARNVGRNLQSQRACREATRIIAVSQYVERFLRERWRLPAAKIRHIYHGADATPLEAAAQRPSWLPASDRPFLFTAGSIRPARGLEDLIGAFGLISAQCPQLELIVAGGVDPGMQWYERRLRRHVASLGVEERVHWLGPIRRDELSWFYYHCQAFVMTSRAEACPNTALEALAHGCSMISTSTDPMPEFFGALANYYPAGNSRELAATIAADIGGVTATAQRRSACRARAAEFSWRRTAEQTVALLAEAAQEHAVPVRTLRAA